MRKNKLIAFFKSGQSLLRCVQPPAPEVCTHTIYLKENRVFINNALDSLNLSSNKFILVYLSRLLSVLPAHSDIFHCSSPYFFIRQCKYYNYLEI